LDAFVLTDAERRFLLELEARGARFMVVGLTAAALQGANTTTVDIDLWFERISDPRIAEAAVAAGGSLISGFGLMPAALSGPIGDRFDIVLIMSGLGAFDAEYTNTKAVILASKRAADRPKDRAVVPALEEALAAIDDSED
jgi:hypothetical protein